MDDTTSVLNELMVDIFDDILEIEHKVLINGEFKDLSITEIHTLEAIGLCQSPTMTVVAGDLKITMGTLTATVNNLVRKRYVERNRIEEDRRVVKIQLTEKGKAIFKIHKRFHEDMVNEMICILDLEEKKVLVKSLRKLNDFFKKRI